MVILEVADQCPKRWCAEVLVTELPSNERGVSCGSMFRDPDLNVLRCKLLETGFAGYFAGDIMSALSQHPQHFTWGAIAKCGEFTHRNSFPRVGFRLVYGPIC